MYEPFGSYGNQHGRTIQDWSYAASKLKVSRNTVARWERDEMAIPGFLHLALKTLECEAAKARTNSGKG